MAPETPTLDDVLRRAVAGIDDEDVRIFYHYVEEMKAHVRSYLSRKARKGTGESDVVQSALFSLFCDVTSANVPLGDVDEDGYPALWPLLLKYLERHCNKWNQRCKREREVPSDGEAIPVFTDPEDESFESAIETLLRHATPRQIRIAELLIRGWTQAQIAREVRCSEATVSEEKKKIRKLLETA